MKKRLGLATATIAVILAAAIGVSVTVAVIGIMVYRSSQPLAVSRSADADALIERDYKEALSLVENDYADDIDYEKANQAAIQGMLSTLDPHSTFFTRADYDKLKQDHDSEFYGIGVTILRHRDGGYVQSPVADTPAARAGLRYGDRIVEVDGKDAREWTSDQVSKAVRGERGESVTLKVERAGANAPLYFTIVRDAVPLPSIRTAYMIRPGTAYIALTGGFTNTTGDELQTSIAKLKQEGLRQLVLDLRNNPGGLLRESINVASQFLPRGQTIVSVHGRGEYSETTSYQNTAYDPEDFPLVVLVNRNSASASEIVAGAIQDYGRGYLVGETTFGKGLVQHVFSLPYGTGLTLTTHKYLTPYGRSIQRDYSSGSFYDYYVRHDADDEPKTNAQTAPSLPATPNVNAPVAPTPTPTPHPPTGPAVKTAAGRVFYGGGGITPDIEVKPLDVSSPVRGRIFEAAFQFTRELAAGQISGLESYRVEKPLYGHFPRPTDYVVNERVLEAFRAYVRRDPESGLTPALVDAEADYARLRIREEITTAAYGNEAAIRTLLDSDPQLLRALEVFPDAKRLAEMVRNGASQS
ncbi:MAG TPA: S41 family peptidase [Pyrinomonadaceae bacterium]|nr:S41 family peptidase [Pyrinomonadaceae bacterium]